MSEKRKNKVAERKGKWQAMEGGLAQARSWLGSGHTDEHGHAYVVKLLVLHACE